MIYPRELNHSSWINHAKFRRENDSGYFLPTVLPYRPDWLNNIEVRERSIVYSVLVSQYDGQRRYTTSSFCSSNHTCPTVTIELSSTDLFPYIQSQISVREAPTTLAIAVEGVPTRRKNCSHCKPVRLNIWKK